MKKVLCILLAVLMLSMALVACGETNKGPLKLGLGVYTTATATDATADTKGKAQAVTTVAAVLVDANGKIVKCLIDCVDSSVTYNTSGETDSSSWFKSKRWLGEEYGMVAYAGSEKEWFEQVDVFQKLCVGKTAAEVLALVVDGDKGTDEVIDAGCTITVNEMALAVEKAVKNAKDSTATASDTLRLGIDSVCERKDATQDTNAQIKFESNIVAFAVSNERKDDKRAISAACVDCVALSFGATFEGVAVFDASKPVLTKREQGDAYGMVAYGGAKLEWYEQADILESFFVGLDPYDRDTFRGEGRYGNEDVITAGCTIAVGDLINAIGLAYAID